MLHLIFQPEFCTGTLWAVTSIAQHPSNVQKYVQVDATERLDWKIRGNVDQNLASLSIEYSPNKSHVGERKSSLTNPYTTKGAILKQPWAGASPSLQVTA